MPSVKHYTGLMKNYKTATRQQWIAEARKHGAAVDDNSVRTWMEINMDLPAGRVWMDSGCHVISVSGAKGKDCAGILYHLAIERMREGTTECDDPACEVCPSVPDLVTLGQLLRGE